LLIAAATLFGEEAGRLAQRLPRDTTYLFIQVPSLGKGWEGFTSLPLYQAYQDEEVQTFLESFGKNLDELAPGLELDLIEDLLNLPAVFDGEAAFALMERDKNHLDWVFSLCADSDPAAGAAFVEEAVLPFLKSLLPFGPTKRTYGDVELTVFMGPSVSVYLYYNDGQLLFTDQEERMLDLIKERQASLVDNGNFKRALENADKDRSFLIFSTLEGLWNKAYEEMDEEERAVLNASGMDGLRSLFASLTMEGGRATDMIRLDIPGDKRGFFKIFSDAPVDPDLARLAPDNTLALAAGNVRFGDLYKTILDMEKASPDAMRDLRQSADDLAEKLGLRSFSDVVGLLGTEVVLFTALPKGGGLIPETVAALEVLEPDKLQTNLFGLVATLAGADPKTVTYRNRQIHYLPLSEGGPFEVNICWCLTDGYLFLSHHPAILKGLVRRLDQGTRNLKKDPEFIAAWKALPGSSVGVAFAHTRRIFEFVYGLILPIAAMTGEDLPFEPALMPTAEAISSYLSFGLSGVTVDEGGLEVRTESDGYGPTSMAMYGMTIALFWIPFEEWNQSMTRWPSCGRSQKQIHEQLEIYRRSNGAYPADLAKDLEGASWFTCGKAYQDTDYSEDERSAFDDFEYVVSVKKIDPPKTWPEDWMILWDSRPRHNDGRVVLLGSGEVIWLPEKEFQKRLEEQGQ
jgi:hypothetical protein